MSKRMIAIGILALTLAPSARADRGDRIEQRLDARGDRIDHRFDHRADVAAANGHPLRAQRLDAKGARIEQRLDARGDRINERLDARGQRIDERLDGRP